MIRTEGITKDYGRVRALKGVDLTVEREVFGLLGPNGAGKTTLIRILATLLSPTSGIASVFGYDVMQERIAIRRILGYLPQEFQAYPMFTGREYLEYIAMLKGIRRPKEEIERVLAQFHLTRAARRRTKSYSGGMLRRLGIAQALLGSPKVLFVDEPTGGLDPEERVRFRNFLMELAGDRVILLSTHLVEDVAMVCKRLAVLRQGEIIYQGTVSGLVELYRGKIYEVEVAEGDLKEKLSGWGKRALTNQRRGDQVAVRLLGEIEGGRPVTPTLEDAYLALIRS